jgi:ABC-type dipeptide/oligopeptide/nickel transport system ATPase subunit
MPENSSLLLVQNVSNFYINRRFGFLGKKEIKPVLKNINMEIKNGEIFGLTGKSGCGKTTLANCILGLIDYSGDILIEGEKHETRWRKVQMVFQEPGSSLNPCKKIGWLMEEPLVIHKIGNSEERQRMIDEMLLRVGLDRSYKSRRVHELSGGQKQRLCIGRSLILEPSLLIADEAISSLDVSAGSQILNLFRELNKHLGLGILFISHNEGAVEYLCDRVARLIDGEIVVDGPRIFTD